MKLYELIEDLLVLLVCTIVSAACGYALGQRTTPYTHDWSAYVDGNACVHVDMDNGLEWSYQLDDMDAEYALDALERLVDWYAEDDR